MLKLLIVVRGFYPDLSASGNLIFPLVKELSKFYSIDILTLSDIDSSDVIFDTIRVFRKKRNEAKCYRFFNIINRNFKLPYYDAKVFNDMRCEIDKLYTENNYDFVMAVTYEEILALSESIVPINNRSCFIMEKLHETSRLAYFRKLQKKYNFKIYKKIISKMDKVFVLPVVSAILDKYKLGGAIELEHSMVVDNIINKFQCNNEEGFQLTYIGGLDKYQRDPWPIMEFVSSLNIELKFNVYGYGNAIGCNSKLPTDCYFHGILKLDKNKEVLNKTDILISIGNYENDIFPSKIFDYLSTGLPIIHFSQNYDDPYYGYLNEYPNALIINNNDIINDKGNCMSVVSDFIVKKTGTICCYDDIANKFFKQTPMYSAEIIKNNLV